MLACLFITTGGITCEETIESPAEESENNNSTTPATRIQCESRDDEVSTDIYIYMSIARVIRERTQQRKSSKPIRLSGNSGVF